MRGILLAGGSGSRLYPLSLVSSKQLQPVYDKPMVYYPLTTLIECGIREICLISSPDDLPSYRRLFGDGSGLGLSMEYRIQQKPGGIAQAFLIADSFLGSEPVCLILGDNIFHGEPLLQQAVRSFSEGGVVLGYRVQNPERYGVVTFDPEGMAVSIEEKPKKPGSPFAVPGFYLYDSGVLDIAKSLLPSWRGELEITDVNLEYLKRGQLKVYPMSRGSAWLDAGTSSSLHEAAAFVQTIERRQGIKIGCPEEAALRSGFLTPAGLQKRLETMPACEYATYLRQVLQKCQHGKLE